MRCLHAVEQMMRGERNSKRQAGSRFFPGVVLPGLDTEIHRYAAGNELLNQ